MKNTCKPCACGETSRKPMKGEILENISLMEPNHNNKIQKQKKNNKRNQKSIQSKYKFKFINNDYLLILFCFVGI